MLELHEPHELRVGLRVRGLVAAGDVKIVAVEPRDNEIVNVVYQGDDDRNGPVSQRLSRMAR